MGDRRTLIVANEELGILNQTSKKTFQLDYFTFKVSFTDSIFLNKILAQIG